MCHVDGRVSKVLSLDQNIAHVAQKQKSALHPLVEPRTNFSPIQFFSRLYEFRSRALIIICVLVFLPCLNLHQTTCWVGFHASTCYRMWGLYSELWMKRGIFGGVYNFKHLRDIIIFPHIKSISLLFRKSQYIIFFIKCCVLFAIKFYVHLICKTCKFNLHLICKTHIARLGLEKRFY